MVVQKFIFVDNISVNQCQQQHTSAKSALHRQRESMAYDMNPLGMIFAFGQDASIATVVAASTVLQLYNCVQTRTHHVLW